MDTVTDKHLSFPQRHWLILCILVAILSPLLVNAIGAITRKKNYTEATQRPAAGTTTGRSSPPGGAASTGDTAKKDTSYKVPVPPQQK